MFNSHWGNLDVTSHLYASLRLKSALNWPRIFCILKKNVVKHRKYLHFQRNFTKLAKDDLVWNAFKELTSHRLSSGEREHLRLWTSRERVCCLPIQFAEVIVSLEKRHILYSQTFKRVAVWRISKQIINKRFAWINDAWLYCLYYPSGNLNIKGWVSIFSSSLVKPKKVIFSRYQFFCSSIESHVGQARNMSIGEHRHCCVMICMGKNLSFL